MEAGQRVTYHETGVNGFRFPDGTTKLKMPNLHCLMPFMQGTESTLRSSLSKECRGNDTRPVTV